MRNALIWLYWRLGAAALTRRLLVSGGRFVLAFHGIQRRRYQDLPREAQSHLSVEELRFILGWLEDRFPFLTPTEFFRSSKPGVLLTFDDGFANNYTNALPVLADFQAPAIFFVTTQHVLHPRDWLPATRRMARYQWEKDEDVPDAIAVDLFDGMSADQLVACAASPLVTIGSHTVTHPFLTRCSRASLADELLVSRHQLQDLSGRKVEFLAYPTGDYDRVVAEAAQAAGYRAAFAEKARSIGLPIFEIPRIGIYSAHGAYLSGKLSGLYCQPIRDPLPGLQQTRSVIRC